MIIKAMDYYCNTKAPYGTTTNYTYTNTHVNTYIHTFMYTHTNNAEIILVLFERTRVSLAHAKDRIASVLVSLP